MRQPSKLLLLAMALGIFLFSSHGWAWDNHPRSSKEASAAAPARLFGSGKQEIALAVGYAIPLPLGGRTPDIEDGQYVFLAPRWGIGITDPLGGRARGTGATLSCSGEGSFSLKLSRKVGSQADSLYSSGAISFPRGNSFRL
jgi:hypothetical protein